MVFFVHVNTDLLVFREKKSITLGLQIIDSFNRVILILIQSHKEPDLLYCEILPHFSSGLYTLEIRPCLFDNNNFNFEEPFLTVTQSL